MRFNISRFDRVYKSDYSRYEVRSYPIQYRRKYTFSPSITVDVAYRDVISDIEEMDRLLGDVHLNGDDYITAMKDSYASNIRVSLMRDGSDMDVSDIEGFIDDCHAMMDNEVEAVGGPKQEIYNNIRAYANNIGKGNQWDSERIIELHKMLMYGVDERVKPGEIRTGIYAQCDADGRPMSVACPPEFITNELDSLVNWLRGSPYDAICTGMMFVIEFTGIQPFQYGSNRVAHTMFQIIMHNLGLKNIGLCKYDDLIEADRDTYARLVDYAKSEQDYFPVVRYVAEKVHESYRIALRELGPKDRLDGGDGYMILIARYARNIADEFTVAEACSWAPDVREQTIRTKLNALVDLGILDRKGNTRNTRYRYNDFLRYLRNGFNTF